MSPPLTVAERLARFDRVLDRASDAGSNAFTRPLAARAFAAAYGVTEGLVDVQTGAPGTIAVSIDGDVRVLTRADGDALYEGLCARLPLGITLGPVCAKRWVIDEDPC